MREFEASARTVEEAVEKGLQELGVSIGDVEVRVLEEGSKGLFGLFGSRQAKVLLTVKEDDEDPLGDLIAEKSAPKAAKKAAPVKREAKKPEKKPEPAKAPAEEKPAEEKPAEAAPAAADAEETVPAARPEPVKREAKKSGRKGGKKPEKKEETRETDADAEEKNVPATAEELRMEKPEVHVIPADQLDPDSTVGEAYAFLKEMTRLMGVDVAIEMGTDDEGHVYGSMTGDTLGILIGRRGETLDALQYLTSLKINRGKDTYTRVTLDTENYRAKREDTLIRLANRMANRAVRTGRRVSLEPMNPYERRVIHFALQKNDLVDTHSEGDEPNRHVVITLKK